MTKVRDFDQVLEVAARLFGERGYEATRLDDVANELGVLKGSLYYYTSSKAELLLHINGRRLQKLIGNARSILDSDGSAVERMEGILRAHVRSIDEYYPESSQWFVPIIVKPSRNRRGRSNPPPDSGQLHREYAAIVKQAVEDGQASGEFRTDLDPKVASLGLLGACNWLTRWYEKGLRYDIDDIADILLKLLLDGLKAPDRKASS